MLAPELEALIELYRTGAIRRHIDSVHPSTSAAEAFGRLEHGKNVGKV
jgi:hypothetical protein